MAGRIAVVMCVNGHTATPVDERLHSLTEQDPHPDQEVDKHGVMPRLRSNSTATTSKSCGSYPFQSFAARCRRTRLSLPCAIEVTRNVKLFRNRVSIIHSPPQSGFPTPDAGDKKFNSRLVAPTWNKKTASCNRWWRAVSFFCSNDLRPVL